MFRVPWKLLDLKVIRLQKTFLPLRNIFKNNKLILIVFLFLKFSQSFDGFRPRDIHEEFHSSDNKRYI